MNAEEAIYVARSLTTICLDASRLQRKTEHMQEISLLKIDPSNAVQPYKVSVAKKYFF
jgi:2-iminoacetate synthase ThiH